MDCFALSTVYLFQGAKSGISGARGGGVGGTGGGARRAEGGDVSCHKCALSCMEGNHIKSQRGQCCTTKQTEQQQGTEGGTGSSRNTDSGSNCSPLLVVLYVELPIKTTSTTWYNSGRTLSTSTSRMSASRSASLLTCADWTLRPIRRPAGSQEAGTALGLWPCVLTAIAVAAWSV